MSWRAGELASCKVSFTANLPAAGRDAKAQKKSVGGQKGDCFLESFVNTFEAFMVKPWDMMAFFTTKVYPEDTEEVRFIT
jgi:hypothetical protein